MEKQQKPHYVNNAKFSQAVVDYVTECNEHKEAGTPVPVVPNYIAECFLKISQGLSFKSNFSRYTYKEEMIMDAVENCLKAISNYNIETATRTGKPNAFAYFTQISWYAFLRRIEKEKRQQDVKIKYFNESGIEEFLIDPTEDPEASRVIQSFVENIRKKGDDFRQEEDSKTGPKKIVKRKRRSLDSDLEQFLTYD